MVEQTVALLVAWIAAYNNAGVQNIVAEAADQTSEDYDGDGHQSPWCLELHEVRAAPDAEARKRRYRQLLFDCRTCGRSRCGIYQAANME